VATVQTPLIHPLLRAGLDYNEEVHELVKNFRPRQKLFEAMVGMADKIGKIKNKKCM
jgi:hypothetical protein